MIKSPIFRMSHQRLSHLTCRAVQHRSPSVAESVRQSCQRPICLSSNISRTQSASYSSATRQRRTISSISPANTLAANRCLRSPRPFVQISAAFSTTKASRAPAIATLNPRNDDDGNPMVIEISPRAAKVCGDIQRLRLSFTRLQFGSGMLYALSRSGASVGEHQRIYAVACC